MLKTTTVAIRILIMNKKKSPCTSLCLTFYLHVLPTMLNCLKQQNSQAVHKLSYKVIGFQSPNMHSSIKLFIEMFVLAVELCIFIAILNKPFLPLIKIS